MPTLSFASSGALDFIFVGDRLGATYDLRGMAAKFGLTVPDVFPNDFYSRVFLGITDNATVNSSAGNTTTSVTAYGPWTITDNVSWITLSPTSGSASTNVTITRTANTGSQRVGTITLTLTATGQTVQQVITQQAGGVTVTSISVGTAVAAQTACSNFVSSPVTRYYSPAGVGFASATQLWTNTPGTTLAGAAWYSDGSITRNWNGSSFVGDQICIV